MNFGQGYRGFGGYRGCRSGMLLWGAEEKTGLEAITGAVIGLFKGGNIGIGISIVAVIIIIGVVIYFWVNKRKKSKNEKSRNREQSIWWY